MDAYFFQFVDVFYNIYNYFAFPGINENYGTSQLVALAGMVSEMFYFPSDLCNFNGSFIESEMVQQYRLYSFHTFKSFGTVCVPDVLYMCDNYLLFRSKCIFL